MSVTRDTKSELDLRYKEAPVNKKNRHNLSIVAIFPLPSSGNKHEEVLVRSMASHRVGDGLLRQCGGEVLIPLARLLDQIFDLFVGGGNM